MARDPHQAVHIPFRSRVCAQQPIKGRKRKDAPLRSAEGRLGDAAQVENIALAPVGHDHFLDLSPLEEQADAVPGRGQ